MSPDLEGLPGFHWQPSGQSILSGPLLSALEALDRRFLSWARELQAAEYRFPAFIAARELQKLDYFRSFPHLVTFPAALSDQEESLRTFKEMSSLDDSGALKLGPLAPVRDALTPAACYHFYVRFQGARLDDVLDLTTVATCFRRETHYRPLRRQWNFTMREIVRLGTADEVKSFLSAFQERLERLFHSLDLGIAFQAATDPFFDPRHNPKFLAQKLDPVKTEMVFDHDLAIGSLNFHRNFFGETFDIHRSGEPAFSGCVAFGLERWLFALLDRFGPNPDKWPEAVKA